MRDRLVREFCGEDRVEGHAVRASDDPARLRLREGVGEGMEGRQGQLDGLDAAEKPRGWPVPSRFRRIRLRLCAAARSGYQAVALLIPRTVARRRPPDSQRWAKVHSTTSPRWRKSCWPRSLVTRSWLVSKADFPASGLSSQRRWPFTLGSEKDVARSRSAQSDNVSSLQ